MFLSSLVTSKLVVAAAATGLVAIGGTATAAAFAGALPASLQTTAHTTLGAPAPDDGTEQEPSTDTSTDPTSPTDSEPTDSESPAPTSTPVGPDATGPAAFGLCNAYAHGGLATVSVAYQSLVTAAGGADGIEAYCLTVVKPGASANHAADKPKSDAGDKPKGRPADKPKTHPTGKPVTVPVGPATGRPTH